MLEQREVEVEGDKYLLTMFTTTKGLEYQRKIGKIIAPIFGAALKNAEAGQYQAVGEALDKVPNALDNIDPEFIKELITNGATKGSMAINFDQEFAGKYVKMFKLFKEILQFNNFEEVFTMVGSLLG